MRAALTTAGQDGAPGSRPVREMDDRSAGGVLGSVPAFGSHYVTLVPDIDRTRTIRGWPGPLCVERVRRIELPYSAWEADVLPLNYTREEAPPYHWRLRYRPPHPGGWRQFGVGFEAVLLRGRLSTTGVDPPSLGRPIRPSACASAVATALS